MLYLVATPIGNLKDITLRALDILKTVEYILCEDTRHSLPLLTHYGIQKPLKSFHKFNESFKEDTIISDLQSGLSIALISDAGTPGIADPGAALVARCATENITVQSIPGPCAAIAAIACSGLDTTRFQFFGFLPKKSGELQHALKELLAYSGTTICYESPHRLLDALTVLETLAPNRTLVVCRELTKKFEEVCRGTANELLKIWQEKEIKGEVVLLIAGQQENLSKEWNTLTPQEHVIFLETTYQLSRHDAIKMAAEMRGVPKRDVYNLLHSPKS